MRKAIATAKATDALNAVCPYYTMFPIEYPLSILRSLGKQKLKVLDPFCGRGTTVFAARTLGHAGYGVDSSPVAVAIARAKIARCTASEVTALAEKLFRSNARVYVPRGEFWRWAFAPETLKAVCHLRAGLRHARSDAAAMLRAICLGALHGPRAKHVENSGYFSNQMPRTFSSKPAYSVKFWKERDLQPPEIDVLGVIKRRISRLNLDHLDAPKGKPVVSHGDSRSKTSYRNFIGKVDAVITSPPYYGMRTYISDQWLRNWFVGGPARVDYAENDQLSHLTPDSFALSLAKVWDHLGDALRPSGRMFIRFGAIPSRKRDACDIMLMSLGTSRHDWTVKSIAGASTAEAGKRQAGQMGERIQSSSKEEFDFEVVLGN